MRGPMKGKRRVVSGVLILAAGTVLTLAMPRPSEAAPDWRWKDAFGACKGSCDPNVYACPCVKASLE